jgi:hypothetical protein
VCYKSALPGCALTGQSPSFSHRCATSFHHAKPRERTARVLEAPALNYAPRRLVLLYRVWLASNVAYRACNIAATV